MRQMHAIWQAALIALSVISNSLLAYLLLKPNFGCKRHCLLRRLAAMSVNTGACQCPHHPNTGLGEILPPALQASLKVGSCCLVKATKAAGVR